jgi:hypothetical protein
MWHLVLGEYNVEIVNFKEFILGWKEGLMGCGRREGSVTEGFCGQGAGLVQRSTSITTKNDTFFDSAITSDFFLTLD